jgi:PAS domain S-box-containing protein
MSEVRRLYLQSLREYVHNKGDQGLNHSSTVAPLLSTFLPEEIILLHEESMKELISHVSFEEALHFYHKSFIFLTELIVSSRDSHNFEQRNEQVLTELRELLDKTEQSLSSVKIKYENVLQHMDSGIALFDQEGYLSFANVKMGQFLGISRQKILGGSLKSLIRNPELTRSTRKLILRLYREMYVYRVVFQEVSDDKGRHLLITMKFNEELEGDILISVKDVTEFRKIEQSAYYNDKLAMLGKIAAAIAHEIRNPLTSIRGFIQLLKPELTLLGKQEYCDIIMNEIDRANEIIHEFLNSSKPTAPVKQEVKIAELIKDVSLLFESEAILKGCEIEFEAMDKHLHVWADMKQIKQVFLNIVKNALEVLSQNKSAQKGCIQINAEQKDSFVIITIADNGPGIDTDTMSRLFDPFFTTKDEGTGLGLSVSYRIIKNHGGTIQVESKVGKGTQFRIHLPLK